MIDFSINPREKTEEERRFDELNEKYTEKFGVPYHFAIGVDMQTMEEAIKDIERRIKTGEKQDEPDYEPGLNY